MEKLISSTLDGHYQGVKFKTISTIRFLKEQILTKCKDCNIEMYSYERNPSCLSCIMNTPDGEDSFGLTLTTLRKAWKEYLGGHKLYNGESQEVSKS